MPKTRSEATFRPPWLEDAYWTKVRNAPSSAIHTPPASRPTDRLSFVTRLSGWMTERFPVITNWHSRWKTSLWTSIALHVMVLLILAFVVAQSLDRDMATLNPLETRWNDEVNDSEMKIEELATGDAASLTVALQTRQDLQPFTSRMHTIVTSASRREPSVDLADSRLPIEGGWERSPIMDHITDDVGISSGVALDGTGLGIGTSGDGEKSKDFFGINVEGNKFVYVVDASRSMNHPHASAAGTRFNRVKIELVNSIGQMSQDSQFFVIFFNDQAIPMPADGLVNATLDNQMRCLKWVATARTGGQTNPRDALMIALRLNPDVIYFLTDGEFEFNVVKQVKAANKLKTPIYTFCFSDRSGEKFLKQIATQNYGKYHFVP